MSDLQAAQAVLLALFGLGFGAVAGWVTGVLSGLIPFSC
jgi:hypothetical protein